MSSEGVPQVEPLVHVGQLSPDAARCIDEVCDYFEHQLYIQGRPRIEDLLRGFQEPHRTILLRELLFLELETYVARDSCPDAAAYYQRFASHVKLVREVFEALFPAPVAPEPADDEPWPEIPNYLVLERISQGGMGRVYKAIHTRLGAPVALKVLHKTLASDPEAVARFEREMMAIGTLAHPNIIVARDAGKPAGTHYLVMEFVEGLDLQAVLERVGTLSVADACEIGRCVASALQCAHRHNVVHRDIKPQNVLLGRCPPDADEVQVKVVDFGLATLRSGAALRDAAIPYARVVGTYAYMAPEQFAEQKVDIRSDIYSLGCTLHCLLLGRPPFTRPQYQDAKQIMAAHVTVPVPPFRKLRPDVSESLERAVLNMLAKDPADRFQTPAEVVRLLTPLAEGHDLPGLLARAESLGPAAASPAGEAHAPARAGPPPAPGPPEQPAPPRRTSGLEETVDHVVQAAPRDETHPVAVPQREPVAPDQRAMRRAGLGRGLRLVLYVAAAIAVGAPVALLVGHLLRPEPIDLLAQVDPERDSVSGGWKLENNVLVSPDAPFARLRLPHPPTEQYRLEIRTERVSGGQLAVGLVWQGRQIPVVVNTIVVRGENPREASPGQELPPSLLREYGFRGGRKQTITCVVRRQGVLVAYEDDVSFFHALGSSGPPSDSRWQTPDASCLFLGTNFSVYRFPEIQLTPLD